MTHTGGISPQTHGATVMSLLHKSEKAALGRWPREGSSRTFRGGISVFALPGAARFHGDRGRVSNGPTWDQAAWLGGVASWPPSRERSGKWGPLGGPAGQHEVPSGVGLSSAHCVAPSSPMASGYRVLTCDIERAPVRVSQRTTEVTGCTLCSRTAVNGHLPPLLSTPRGPQGTAWPHGARGIRALGSGEGRAPAPAESRHGVTAAHPASAPPFSVPEPPPRSSQAVPHGKLGASPGLAQRSHGCVHLTPQQASV